MLILGRVFLELSLEISDLFLFGRQVAVGGACFVRLTQQLLEFFLLGLDGILNFLSGGFISGSNFLDLFGLTFNEGFKFSDLVFYLGVRLDGVLGGELGGISSGVFFELKLDVLLAAKLLELVLGFVILAEEFVILDFTG